MADYFTEGQIDEFRKAFNLLDKNGDGELSYAELRKSLRKMGQNPTDTDVKHIITSVDTDGDGKMDFEEFLGLMKLKFQNRDPKEELRLAFQVFDANNDGYITAKELQRVLTKLGEKMTKEEAEEMVKEADLNGNGKIEYEEFVETMMKQFS